MKPTSMGQLGLGLPKAANVYPASGQSSERVPMEDMGKNRRPSMSIHVIKGNLVGPGGWSVIMILEQILGLGSPSTNSPMVGGAPGYGFHPSQDLEGVMTLTVF